MKITPGKLWGMRRLADRNGFWRIVATDQREMFAEMIAGARGVEVADYTDVSGLVTALSTELQDEATALLFDPIYGYPAAIEKVDPAKGVMHSYESLYFDSTPGGTRMEPIPGWSVEKIRRLGGDAVKVLALYRADSSPEVRKHQEDFVQHAGEECVKHDIPMLLEILVYPGPEEDAETYQANRRQLVLDAVRPFRDPKFHVDIYKLEPPGPLVDVAELDGPGGAEQQAAYRELTDGLPAPWVLLSAGMDKANFRRSLDHAMASGASGYLAGRALWSQAPAFFPDMEAVVKSLHEESVPYMRELNAVTAERATPWFEHPSYGGKVEPSYELDREFALHY